MSHQTRTANTTATVLRAVPRTVCDDPTDDRYVDLSERRSTQSRE